MPVCIPYAGGNSYLFIDPSSPNGVQIYDLFNFVMDSPIEFASDTRAFNGSLHTVMVAFKDKINIQFPKLTQAQANLLNVLLQQTGLNAFHTVIYGTDNLIRKWDGTTAWSAGYGINDDVQRLRKQIRFKPLKLVHWPNIANTYSAELQGEEV